MKRFALIIASIVAAACSKHATIPLELPPPLNPPEAQPDRRAADPPADLTISPSADDRVGELPGNVNFAQHVAPIVYSHCVACHHDGGAGPFSFIGYEAVRKRAKQIVEVTGSRYMPPWQPTHGYDDLEGERRLTAREQALLAKWVAGGAVEGPRGATPKPPTFTPGWQLGVPDKVVRFPEPYRLQAGGFDVFQNFVVPSGASELRYIRGIEFKHEGGKVIHHVEIRIDETAGSRERDAAEPGPGFAGMDSPSAHFPEGHFLNWVPGSVPVMEPASRAWDLSPGTDFVVQLHMVPSGKEELVQPEIGLYYADGPPTEVVPVNLRLGVRTMDIAAGDEHYTVRTSYTLPVDVDLLSVLPHAHYICRQMKGWAVLPDGTKRWLIRIDDWDFNWQDSYRYKQPIALPQGTVLAMQYSFDNSSKNPRNPHKPPQRVTYGPRSTDEMADFWVRVRPHSELDRQKLKAHQFRQRTLEEIAEAESQLGPQPTVAKLMRLAELHDRLGMHPRATLYYRAAVAVEPQTAGTHERYALALRQAQKPSEALAEIERAVELDPRSAGTVLNRGIMQSESGDTSGALESFRRAVELDPKLARAQWQCAIAEEAAGNDKAALRGYEAAATIDPSLNQAADGAARLLALLPHDAGGDLDRAAKFIARARQGTRDFDPFVLRTAALVAAQRGEYDEAIGLMQQALMRLGPAADALAKGHMIADLERYRAHRPTTAKEYGR